jgi:hypothetical protein
VLHPNSEDAQKYSVKVNGELITEPTLLKHGDRLLVGSHYYYIYVDPLINADEQVEFEFALKEANKD